MREKPLCCPTLIHQNEHAIQSCNPKITIFPCILYSRFLDRCFPRSSTAQHELLRVHEGLPTSTAHPIVQLDDLLVQIGFITISAILGVHQTKIEHSMTIRFQIFYDLSMNQKDFIIEKPQSKSKGGQVLFSLKSTIKTSKSRI